MGAPLICHDCGNGNLLDCHKYCRKCATENPSYVEPSLKIAEPTHLEIRLAKLLRAHGVAFTLQPEMWYSSCTYWTPDFLIDNRIVTEIDGQAHYTDEHQVLMDRIKSRAIEASGFPVFRFKNNQVVESPLEVVDKIREIMSQNKPAVGEGQLIQVNIPAEERMSNIMEDHLKEMAALLKANLGEDKWSAENFKSFLLQFNPSPNRCAMLKIMLILHGLNFRASADGKADFNRHADIFTKELDIIREMFDDVAPIELRNEFTISATNFLKNIVFNGRPNILPYRVVRIDTLEKMKELLNDFNERFSQFGIRVSESELKIECRHEIKRKNLKRGDYRPPFEWLGPWCK